MSTENLVTEEPKKKKKRKKIIPIIIVIILLVAAVKCCSGGDDTDNSKNASSADSATKTAQITLDEQVVYDNNGITVKVKSIDTEDFWGPSIKFEITNDTDKNITVSSQNVSLNGIMVDPIFVADVAAGKTANEDMTFFETELKVADIETIKDIEFNLYIYNADTWNEIDTSDTISLTTNGSEDYEQSVDDSGTVALDKDGIKLVVKKLDSEDSFWGADIYVYVENNTEQDITIQVDNVSINGYMVDPIFSCEVASGKKAFDTITFLDSDLEDNGIEDITDLELNFHVFNTNSWNDIFDSDTVNITFE